METEPAHPRRPALGWLCRPGADGAAAMARRPRPPAARRPGTGAARGRPGASGQGWGRAGVGGWSSQTSAPVAGESDGPSPRPERPTGLLTSSGPARAATTCSPRASRRASSRPAGAEVVPAGTADRGEALKRRRWSRFPTSGAAREDAPAGGPGPGRAAPRGATGGPRPVDELTNAAGRRGAGLQRRARIRAQPTHSCLRRAEKIATTRFHQLDIDFGRELAASHKSRGRSHAHGRLLSHVSSHLAGSGLCAVTTTAGDSFPAGMRQTT